MKYNYYLLILVMLCGCGKESMNPIFNSHSLIGQWISRTGNPLFEIKNLDNLGETERYLVFNEGGSRFIQRTHNGIATQYQILFINEYELKLSDRRGTAVIEFLRIK